MHSQFPRCRLNAPGGEGSDRLAAKVPPQRIWVDPGGYADAKPVRRRYRCPIDLHGTGVCPVPQGSLLHAMSRVSQGTLVVPAVFLVLLIQLRLELHAQAIDALTQSLWLMLPQPGFLDEAT